MFGVSFHEEIKILSLLVEIESRFLVEEGKKKNRKKVKRKQGDGDCRELKRFSCL